MLHEADDTITLSYEGRKTKLTLVGRKIQVAAVKEAFQLQGLALNGCIEPVDGNGFTYRTYKPSDTVEVTVPGGGYPGSTRKWMYVGGYLCSTRACTQVFLNGLRVRDSARQRHEFTRG